MSTDWSKIVGNTGNQYEQRIKCLQDEDMETKAIEDTVQETLHNLQNNDSESLVVFGEPQSGKTEMMIALNAKLLDAGYPISLIC